VELISRLQFESQYDAAKTCVKALYVLNRQDKRIFELQDLVEQLESKLKTLGEKSESD
jgi:hypothetical protein